MSACGKKGSKKEPCCKVIRSFSYACPKNACPEFIMHNAWKEREVVFPFETNNLKMEHNNLLLCLSE